MDGEEGGPGPIICLLGGCSFPVARSEAFALFFLLVLFLLGSMEGRRSACPTLTAGLRMVHGGRIGAGLKAKNESSWHNSLGSDEAG